MIYIVLTYICIWGFGVLIPSVGKSEINKVISEGYLQVGHPGQYCVSGVQVIVQVGAVPGP